MESSIALKYLSPSPPLASSARLCFFSSKLRGTRPTSVPCHDLEWRSKRFVFKQKMVVKASAKVEETSAKESAYKSEWGKVSAVLFDMDGVLCNSEDLSRRAGVDVFSELGVEVTPEDFVPFMGTGEANFLGGVASVKGVAGFSPEAAKKRFFEIYLEKYAKPNSGIGFPGALELITECKSKGLKVAVASSADRIKVDANLAAAGLPLSMFDAIVSADAFENLKPAPDIFIAASKLLNVPTDECIVIEDALAGVQAAQAAKMRCIAVKTTLSDETLKIAGPSLIRNDIGNITIHDILSGGSDASNEKIQGSQFLQTSEQISPRKDTSGIDAAAAVQDSEAVNDGSLSIGRLQGTRRDIVRYGSLGIALSCLVFTITNWKAMQYTSPKAIWNLFFGVNQPSFQNNASSGGLVRDRIQRFIEYISEIETRETAPVVPEFPSKLDWLNSSPLRFRKDLKGKVVLLDFWTYCCINCMHVLPDLEYLEKKYDDKAFVVVGVHSAKFDNEKDLEAIRNAVIRYGITHPVVNDGDMFLWRELGINSWPTFAIVGPNGKLLAQISGEGRRKDLDDFVEAALLFYSEKKILDSRPLPLRLEKDSDPRLITSPLKFPGKLTIDVLNNRLFISDSNHNRIVVTDLSGNFLIQIGSTGEDGLRDGTFDDATFNRPQGLAYNAKKNLLYVADTENHALREIDFVRETVRTLTGNGTKGSDYQGGKEGTSQLLNSPWDVCFEPISEKVYIAMAGQHQIWVHDTLNGVTKSFSGDGFERNLNGSSSSSSSFAQPSGLSVSPAIAWFVDSSEVYIADSESSSIRAVDLKTGGSRLLAGGDPIFSDNLFKIKRLDPVSKRVTTIAGTGKAGLKDGTALAAQLSEPSGITEAEGRLFISDTNNNVIRYLDLNNKEQPQLLTLELKGVQPPNPKPKSFKRLRKRSSDTQTIVVDGGSFREGNLSLKISLPEEYHFSKEARSKFIVETEPESALSIDPSDGYLSPDGFANLRFRRSSPAASLGRISCKVYYCKEDEVCLYKSLSFEVPFREELSDTSRAEITLAFEVKPKASTSSLPL
ncbi:protein SUPPRESSOR OF QUENCHING 1, chloroplastic isoform X3 [Cucurbita moschata]|uniref:Protein SUPPRESSOR OF QUENCHING 1, chloroplastic isoform X3 n=1 Tax=Cucurbita moschata TaxID=3662 RepID=A0A6J1HDY1_CUCMO|nr:protein SUPPRESSOR OF QUENCHING 1, chloroplastic isoform X3 [Cucurbita moschata]